MQGFLLLALKKLELRSARSNFMFFSQRKWFHIVNASCRPFALVKYSLGNFIVESYLLWHLLSLSQFFGLCVKGKQIVSSSGITFANVSSSVNYCLLMSSHALLLYGQLADLWENVRIETHQSNLALSSFLLNLTNLFFVLELRCLSWHYDMNMHIIYMNNDVCLDIMIWICILYIWTKMFVLTLWYEYAYYIYEQSNRLLNNLNGRHDNMMLGPTLGSLRRKTATATKTSLENKK